MPSQTSHDQPEPNRFTPPSFIAVRSASNEPNVSSIADTFDSFDNLKQQMNDAGVKRFGSGWSWLVWDGTGLAVYSTPNQDSPILKSFDDVPLLGIDVWEHAYYLTYQNKRPAYLEAWWNVVNWDEVARRYDEARSS